MQSWDNFIGSKFLKAKDVASEQDAYVVIIANAIEDKGEVRLRLSLERHGQEFDFDVNATNSKFIQNAGIKSPAHLFGKKLYFKKVLTTNPSTKTEVEGLRVWRVE